MRVTTYGFAALLAVSSHAVASTRTWDGGEHGTGTNWFDEKNWSPDGFPEADDTLTVYSGSPSAGTVSVGGIIEVSTSDASASFGTLFVGNGKSDGILELSKRATVTVGGLLHIGNSEGSIGTVTVDDAVLSTLGLSVGWNGGEATLWIVEEGHVKNNGNTAQIGVQSGSIAEAYVIGPMSVWEDTARLFVVGGEGGTGTLDVSDGGKVTSTGDFYVGNETLSEGTVTVDTAELIIDGFGKTFSVGRSGGTGSLWIIEEGVVTTKSEFTQIGVQAGSTGEVYVAGSLALWENTADILVVGGEGGKGVLDVSDGGKVTSASNFYVGEDPDSEGTVTVSNAEVAMTSTEDFFIVGRNGGKGELWIDDGGKVNSDGQTTNIGVHDGSTGKAYVIGAASVWEDKADFFAVGNDGGKGTLEVSDGGKVTSSGNLHIGDDPGSEGRVTVSNAELAMTTVGEFLVVGSFGGKGTLEVSDGGKVTSAGNLYIGDNSGSEGTVTVSNAELAMTTVEDFFVVGNVGGKGTLEVSDGGKVTSAGNLYIGDNSGSEGTVTVSNAELAMTTVEDFFVVGNVGGKGTLEVSDGGKVTSSGNLHIGDDPGSEGRVTVSNAELAMTTVGEFLVVGSFGGKGTLEVSDGGKVTSAGNLYIGDNSGSEGTVTVSNAELAMTTVEDFFVVGNVGGKGTLEVSDGGKVTSAGNFYIGDNSGSEGTVTVSNAELAMTTVEDFFVVGNVGGKGTLEVSDGGKVTSAGNFYIGDDPGSEGTVTVSSAELSMTSTSTDDFFLVGNDGGKGTLDVSDGGKVTSDGDFYIGSGQGSDGTVIVNDAELLITNIDKDLDVGHHSKGLLEVINGGKVISRGNIAVGSISGSQGRFIVRGFGSVVRVEDDVRDENLFHLGGLVAVGVFEGSDGYLEISEGGLVSSSEGTIAEKPGSTGAVLVNGSDSRWDITKGLSIGGAVYGFSVGSPGAGTTSGSLDIEDGGMVTAANIAVGGIVPFEREAGFESDNPIGNVTVRDSGSAFSASELLVVGESGQGALIIEKEATVTSRTGVIGQRAGSQGDVTIRDNKSSWTVADNLVVGNLGNGHIKIMGDEASLSARDISLGGDTATTTPNDPQPGSGTLEVGQIGGPGGKVTATNSVTIRPMGQVLLAGGTIETGRLDIARTPGNGSNGNPGELWGHGLILGKPGTDEPTVVLNNGHIRLNGKTIEAPFETIPASRTTKANIYIEGDFIQRKNGVLSVPITDQNRVDAPPLEKIIPLVVDGTAVLNGTLRLMPNLDTIPDKYDRYLVMKYFGDLEGRFSKVEGTDLNDKYFLGLNYLENEKAIHAMALEKPKLINRPLFLNNTTSSSNKLVLVTHGTKANAKTWVSDIASAIHDVTKNNTSGWDVVTFDWSGELYGLGANDQPIDTAELAIDIGESIAHFLNDPSVGLGHYTNIHAMGHSSGSWLADGLIDQMELNSNRAISSHLTVFDAFTPFLWPFIVNKPGVGKLGPEAIGESADWAEHILDSTLSFPTATQEILPKTFNVDVTELRPFSINPLFWHAWPYAWYLDTAKDPKSSSSPGVIFGFPSSLEWRERAGLLKHNGLLERGNVLYVLRSGVFQDRGHTRPEPGFEDVYYFDEVHFSSQTNVTSTTGTIVIDPVDGVILSTGSPVFLTSFIEIDERANLLKFDFSFLSDAEGLLSVYLEGDQIFGIDESLLPNDIDTFFSGDIILDNILEPGIHTLLIRLDPLSDEQSIVKIDNLQFGFADLALIPEPTTLFIVLSGGFLVFRRQNRLPI